jgi:hypothetical protein
MGYIGSCFQQLEGWIGSFSVEVFSGILRPEWIGAALKETGRETTRERKLTAPFTLWLVVGMGLYRSLSIQNILNRMGNVLGSGSLWKDGKIPASSSTTEARDRLGFGSLRWLVGMLRTWALEVHREAMEWKGFLLLAIDGSTFKVPDSPRNRKHFGLPGTSRGGRAAFPQMRALFLVSTRLHLVLHALFAPYKRAEIHMALRMLRSIPRGALVLLDRNFNAWEFLIGVLEEGSQFLVRAKDNMRGEVLEVLGRGDRIVRMKIHAALRQRLPHLPKTLVVREISVRILGKRYRFFTSLLDPKRYATEELAGVYHQRWEEEILLDSIKTHQCAATTVNRPVIFRCQTPRRVLQEAFGLVLSFNLVRALILEAGERHDVPPLRISFVDSLERIRDAALIMAASPTHRLPRIYDDLLQSISRCVLPPRRHRCNPRVVCVKMSRYPKKGKVAA